MTKSLRRNLQGLITPSPSHNRVIEQSRENVGAQLHDADVPAALPELQEPEIRAPQPTARSGRKKVERSAEPESKDYVHRSLYARPETLELIREIAFKERISAQSLYREGLFLMLRARGHYEDKTIDDV